MTSTLHVDLHLHGPLDSLPVDILTVESGPFATVEIPIGEARLTLIATDPADLRALAAMFDLAAGELEMARCAWRVASMETPA